MKGIYLEAELLNSPAFQRLSRWGLRVYLRFLTKRVMVKRKSKDRAVTHSIANNGEIVFCYSEAVKMGIPRREFRNALDELVDKGFLDINHQGAGGRTKDMSTYFVGKRWEKWDTPEYQPTPNPRKKDTRQGRGWAAWHARKKQSSVTISPPEIPLSNSENVTRKGKKKVFRLTKTPLEKTRKIAASC
jgi:hypothetical protein